MTSEAVKKPIKPKVGKVPAESKERAAKAVPAAPPAKKPKVAAGAAIAAGEVKVTQLVGSIARKYDQKATLIGLGLNKRHRSRVLKDTPEVRGMIRKVQHLVKVEQA